MYIYIYKRTIKYNNKKKKKKIIYIYKYNTIINKFNNIIKYVLSFVNKLE